MVAGDIVKVVYPSRLWHDVNLGLISYIGHFGQQMPSDDEWQDLQRMRFIVLSDPKLTYHLIGLEDPGGSRVSRVIGSDHRMYLMNELVAEVV